MSKEDKLYNLLHLHCKLSIPDYWVNYDDAEFRTHLSILMPEFHFEFWYESEDLEINTDCLYTVAQRMMEHKNAKEVYYTDIGGEDYSIFIMAFKD